MFRSHKGRQKKEPIYTQMVPFLCNCYTQQKQKKKKLPISIFKACYICSLSGLECSRQLF